MSRKATGTIFRYVPAKAGEKHGHYVVRCPAPDGSRPLFDLDPSPKSPQAAKRAKETAASITEQLAAGKLGAALSRTPKGRARADREAPEGEGAEWWEKYLRARDAKGLSPVRHVYNGHLAPVLTTHPREWTRLDCERLVAVLDGKIAAKDISWKTAANVWSLFTSACKAASSAKASAGLRVRDDNPCAGVAGPDRGEHRLKQWLYPTEFSALVACPDVPLRWRRLYALLAYLYVRAGELRALEWADVDLEMGTVHVTKSWDEKRGRIKPPKTAAGVRHVAIEPTLLPLLRALHAEGDGTGPVIQAMPPMEDWAEKFRRHLQRAGVSRAELFTTTETHKRITLHDLRATGITWRCIRKDYGPEIQQAAGHEKYDTTDRYIRTARVFVGRVGEPFPALPAGLLGGSTDPDSVTDSVTTRGNPSELLRPQRESNAPTESRSSMNPAGTGEGEGGAIATDSDANHANAGEVVTNGDDSSGAPVAPVVDPIEAALAAGLERATKAEQWDGVLALTAELKARREARAGVVPLDAARRKRER